ncbi:hypothetical protein [Nocardia asiatica]|uniref:hypothetical protein n=1 Tax=Nocardia asiatica TaxID=209252 RepID=UPI0024576C03|nr:hypothetical protein [Nocardia asiatica]
MPSGLRWNWPKPLRGSPTADMWARTFGSAGTHYDEQQLAALVALIAAMNAFNRINAMVRQPAFRWAAARPEQLSQFTVSSPGSGRAAEG